MTRTVAIIPAKAISKRLPGKNMADFHGEPLVVRKVRQLLPAVDEVIVGTDSDEIAAASAAAGASVLMREPYFCDESVCPANDMIRDLVSRVEADTILWAHCTNPLCGSEWYAKALAMHAGSKLSIASARRVQRHAWYELDPLNFSAYGPHRLAATLEPVFVQDGAIFVRDRNTMMAQPAFVDCGTRLMELPWRVGFDVDTPEDMEVARMLAAMDDPEMRMVRVKHVGRIPAPIYSLDD